MNVIDGISCKKFKGVFYVFVKVDMVYFNIKDDECMILDLFKVEKILFVYGCVFNWLDFDYFRLVFLLNKDDLIEVMSKM